MKLSTFIEKGEFYKGNLHSHTTISDGRFSPEELANLYKDKGYDFLSITDHNTVFKSADLNHILYILPGIELHSNAPTGFRTHHMVGLTTYDNEKVRHGEKMDNIKWTDSKKAAVDLYEFLDKKGFESMYCHALWSRTEADEYIKVDNIGLEVYNTGCDWEKGQGYQETHWDYLLRRKKKKWGFATDDGHGSMEHYAKGYTVVKAKSLTDYDIIDALKKGSFYSSQGPEIHDFYVENGKAYIKCSPASVIAFISYEHLGEAFRSDELIREKSFEFHPDCDYIRVEVIDEKGKKAWTNPIFLK